MTSFKQIAYEILKSAGKPLHSREITKRALEQKSIVSDGKTPEATMNAQLIVDINKNKTLSRFIKTGPSMFFVNGEYKPQAIPPEERQKREKQRIISKVSSKQKGDIAEARIAELITLYGDTEISCFKPLSDDEGIDLIVKPKGELKALFIQVKSRFGDDVNEIYTATVKASGVVNSHRMTYVFCYFDTLDGDVWDYVWFVPAPDFLEKATLLKKQGLLSFVAGRKKSAGNKWDQYLIDKTDLSKSIMDQLERL
jgi:hypothetical protein